jgi:hypothetical protein
VLMSGVAMNVTNNLINSIIKHSLNSNYHPQTLIYLIMKLAVSKRLFSAVRTRSLPAIVSDIDGVI